MPGTIKESNLREQLTSVCRGLIYTSETDSKVDPFFGCKTKSITKKIVLEMTGSQTSSHIDEVGFDKFFERLTAEREWYVTAQRKNAKGFAKLKKLLESELKKIRVFRIGRIRIDTYVVGIDCEGNIAGVKTFAVET